MLHVVEGRSLSCSRQAGNGRKSLQSNDPFLVHSGPLPEPVINGEMEEKVRALQALVWHTQSSSTEC